MINKIKLSVLASSLLVSSLSADVDLGMLTVYSATKSEQSIKDVTSNVEVITSTELEERHYTNVAEALNSIAGINITSNGGIGQGSFVRIDGMHYSTTLVLIDGVRYNDITNGSAFLENILVSNIKQIEITKGAQSGIWGADASGGVINIITKDTKDGLNGSVNTEYGSFNTKKYGASVSHKNTNYYVKLNAQKITSNGFSAQVPSGDDIEVYEDDGYENTTTSIKTGFNINEANKIDFSHTIIDSEVEYDSGAWGSSAINQANSTIYSSTSKSRFTKLNFNHIDSFNELDIYANKSSFDRKDPNGYTKQFLGEVKEFGLKSKIEYNKKDFLIFGVDKKDFSQEKAYEFNYTNSGVFLTNSNNLDGVIAGKTVFAQSLRYDEYSEFKNKTTGKIGIKHFHENIKNFTTSLNYGTGYKAPSLYELSHDGGNELKPEYTRSLDVTANYNNFKVRYFQNKIDDLMSYSNNNTPSNYSDDFYENGEGTSIIKGYEVSYKKDIMNDTLFSLNYTKQDAKDKDGKILGRVAEELLKVSIDYYGIDKLHINVNGEYVGDRFDRNGETGTKTGKYTVINSVFNYDVNKDLKVYLKCNNLTNKYYQEVDGYATSPRAYYAGLKVKF